MDSWKIMDGIHEISPVLAPLLEDFESSNRSTMCLTSLLPTSSVHLAASPIVAWVILVTCSTFFPSSLFVNLSLRRSWNELLTARQSSLNALDVFRLVAIVWVMVNHTGSEGRIDVLERLPSADAFKKNVHNDAIFGALFGNSALGVEIFLLLSGLLAARSWFRKADQPFWPHFSSFILRRILRLLPSMFVFVYIASSSLMQSFLPRYHSTMISDCGVMGILSHLTFTSNWQATPTCMGYLWYLGLDMQLYIAAPFLFYLLHKSARRGCSFTFAAIVGSVFLRAHSCMSHNTCNKSDVDIPFISYPGQDAATLNSIYGGLWEMYARPQTKCGPFLVGILLGYATMTTKLEMSKKASYAWFYGSFVAAIAIIYAILPEYWNPDAGTNSYNVAYTATFRTLFSMAIAGMISSFVYHKSNRFSGRYWSILSKLTYNAYLLHMPVVYAFNWLPFLQNATSAIELLAVVPMVAVVSFAAAAIFYVFVESPIGFLTSTYVLKL